MGRVRYARCATSAAVLLVLVAPAPGQLMSPLDGSSQPIQATTLSRVLAMAGVSVPLEAQWKCHGAYLDSVFDRESESQSFARSLSLDGTGFEEPESVKRGAAVVRRSLAAHETAIDELVRCIGESATDDARERLPPVAMELKARMLCTSSLEYGPVHEFGPYQLCFDPWSSLDSLLTEEQRRTVASIVLQYSGSRLRSARTVLESGLENRLKMAELSASLGVTAMTPDAARQILERRSAEEREAYGRAIAAGERPAPPRHWTTELYGLRSCSPCAAHDALVAARELTLAIASALPPELAARTRRDFLERVMGLNDWMTAERWGGARPMSTDARWMARTLLARPDLSPEQRRKARAILSEWSDAELAWKERTAQALLEGMEAMCRSEGRPPRHPFHAMGVEVPELDALSAPFHKRLADALDQPWIADASIEPPPAPTADDGARLEPEDLVLTGSAGALTNPRRAIFEPRVVGFTGWRGVDEMDIEQWCLLADADADLRGRLEAIAQERQAAWNEIVSPIVVRSVEDMPRVPGMYAIRAGEPDPHQAKVDAWQKRVGDAAVELDAAARAWNASLHDALRRTLGEERAWVRAAVEHRRLADRLDATQGSRVHPALMAIDEEVLGGRRVDPVRVVLEAGLPPEAARTAICAAMPMVASLAPLLEEQEAILMGYLRSMGTRSEERNFDQIMDDEMATGRRLLALRDAWRPIETAAIDAAKSVVSESQATRIDRAVMRRRFPSAFTRADEIARVADEARRAANREPDLVRRLEAIALIDAAEESALERIQLRSAAVIAGLSQPPPPVIDSLARLFRECQARRERSNSSGRAPIWETNRFANYLAGALPGEVLWSCPPLVRMASNHGVVLPPRPGAVDAMRDTIATP